MLTIIPQSHLDHHLTAEHIAFLLRHFAEKDAFFAETVRMPDHLPLLPCNLRGPVVGHADVTDAETELRPRAGRGYPSRLLKSPWPPVQSPWLTVIGGPGEGLPCVLYTAYGGPLAPREPGDPSIRDDAERAASEAFWSKHALLP